LPQIYSLIILLLALFLSDFISRIGNQITGEKWWALEQRSILFYQNPENRQIIYWFGLELNFGSQDLQTSDANQLDL